MWAKKVVSWIQLSGFSIQTMLDRNNVGCEKLVPVHVPSTQPNGLQGRQPGHKRNANRKLVHKTHIISVKNGDDGSLCAN